ncbi:MAG: hypothetical protein IH608_07790 [Proteobacteria bacterium]|nr:hypothetical protein [Pseudomonadota bacterium]
MKNLSTLFQAVGLSALALGLAAPALGAHPGIDLRTYPAGAAAAVRDSLHPDDTLPANGNPRGLVAGPPVSPKESCDTCHDYQAITSAYHFQLGLDERVDTDGDGFQDDLGKELAGPGGPLAPLPTLYNVSSPGQFGAW